MSRNNQNNLFGRILQGCRINPNAGHQKPRTGIVKVRSHEQKKKNCSFSPWTVVLSTVVMSFDYGFRWHKNRPVCGGPFPFAHPGCKNESPLSDFTANICPRPIHFGNNKTSVFYTANSTRLIRISQKRCWLRLLSLELLSLSTSSLFFILKKNTKKVQTIKTVNGIKRPYALVCLFQPWGAESRKVRSEHSVAVWFSQVISQAFPTVFPNGAFCIQPCH